MEEIQISDGFYLLKTQNDGNDPQQYERHADSSYIQMHFCLKGSSKFNFNKGRYALEVNEEKALLLYNPQQDLPINLELEPKSWLISVLISIKKFHSLFSQEADYIHFLSEDNKDKKYYTNAPITPAMAVALSQIMNYHVHSSIKTLYLKGKIYELISLYFNKPEDADVEQCPFLIDEDNIRRIRKAKDIVIARMAEPPSLSELSEEIGLNLKKLKEGFKQVYGDSVYSFLFDYKMEYARKVLESGEHNVNEVALKVGYSTSSHFIAAFKKKFGTTPKKYLMSLTNS
ncbi:transcriptional regulator, AraC family [Zhouia amylolytica]|uniref:DNA-binding domain-containing protein, AraC-type n=2 Tax=Zhouia amylolytica TaxID=376730 RepID=W2UJ98_9FLAO|nr:AraC family transcriptional regulator [Zhouia amylolytica]ETN94220.1 DNA-binding domain-containing protein, AraC-type [Zhouia amylolytica AD3]MCQ0111482.1 AraC family transcriptional regulator [Zhouia amylolytica]SFS39519.1 transcriptional regulator, AraC family [Zhouia amylolytica]